LLAGAREDRNIFQSDYETGPIIGPFPRQIQYATDIFKFEECGIKYHEHDQMLDEIIGIYNDVTFGRGHEDRCTTSNDNNLNVHLNFAKKSSEYLQSDLHTDYEKYTLVASKDGKVEITADYYTGIVRGLDTLSQLITQDVNKSSSSYEIKYLPINITDFPEYPYRGIMIDTAREFIYPNVLKTSLDGMMLGRNNIFHWHFAEDDSIPMFSKSFPNLVDYTAFRPSEIYTPEAAKDIVQYARIRGIKVIPEMEGPSHLHILGYYPEFKNMVG
jgi:hypothetical protein